MQEKKYGGSHSKCFGEPQCYRGYWWGGGEPKLSNIQRQSGRRHQERSPRKSGWSAGIRKEFHWRELREEGSGKQTGPEGKARIGVTSAETELGYSRKQTGEPRPEPKGLCSGRSESGLGSGRLSLLPWEISSFKVGPGDGHCLGPDLEEGCGRLSKADMWVPAPILPQSVSLNPLSMG